MPEPGILASYDEYDVMVRQVFADAYNGDVVLRVVIEPSFVPEEVVGIRKTEKGFEAFAMTPSSMIWKTELVRITTFDKAGKKQPPEKDDSFQEFKRQTPSDIPKITAHIDSAALPALLAQRIARVWKSMLLDARHPKNPHPGLDGASYHFSMWVQNHGDISGEIWSPDERTKTSALVNLATALSQYAKGRIDAQELPKALKPLE